MRMHCGQARRFREDILPLMSLEAVELFVDHSVFGACRRHQFLLICSLIDTIDHQMLLLRNGLDKNLVLLLLVVLAGVLLRSIYPTNIPFGFDQVQIARAAEAIAQGDFTLIGPRTGPADMFTGPLIYYLAGIFTLFMPSYYAVFVTALTIAALTGLVILMLVRRYQPFRVQLSMLVCWSFSPFLLVLDRIPWNPNLLVMASTMVFLPLTKNKKLGLLDMTIIATGIFLGYQAHFSGLLLLPLVFLSVILFRSPKLKTIGLSTIGLAATLLPTFLFDLKNNWLNATGLSSLLSNSDRVSDFRIFDRLIEKIYIVVETLGKILFAPAHSSLIFISGLSLLLLFILFSVHKWKSTGKISLLWILCVIFAYALYRDSTPEYYFLLLVPVLILIISKLWAQIGSLTLWFGTLVFFALSSSVYAFHVFHLSESMNLAVQLKAVNYLSNLQQTASIRSIIYDIAPIESVGLHYLLDDKVGFSEQGRDVHVAYPASVENFTSFALSNNAKIWIDSRNDQKQNYASFDRYILGYPLGTRLVQNLHNPQRKVVDAEFVLFTEETDFKKSQALELLVLIDQQQSEELYKSLMNTFADGSVRITIPTSMGEVELGFVAEHRGQLFLSSLGQASAVKLLFE